jgi:hypothetical protein
VRNVYLLKIDDRSGVMTFDPGAAERWVAMVKEVEDLGETTDAFERIVDEADKTIGEWLARHEARTAPVGHTADGTPVYRLGGGHPAPAPRCDCTEWHCPLSHGEPMSVEVKP